AFRDAESAGEATITFGELFELYYERHVKTRTRDPENAYYFYKVHGDRWGGMPVSAITRMDVQNWVDELGTASKSSATRAVNMLNAVISWGIKRGYVNGENPCKGVERFTIKARERFLYPAERPRLIAALEDETPIFRDFFHILLLTGARRGNVLSMRWEDIDFDLKIWSFLSKNGDTQVLPLTPESLFILERRREVAAGSEYVFPGRNGRSHLKEPKRAWKRVLKRAGLENVRIHDLRRTFASYLAIQGESQYIIGRALGHKDQRSTAVYARLNLRPVREAMEKLNRTWLAPGAELDAAQIQEVQIESKLQAVDEGRTISRAEQAIVEGKILAAITSGANTKKKFHQKLGGRSRKVDAAELERILTEMIERNLICKYRDDAKWELWRYALAEG
ncbi:MAG: site-specific integrase, partial [Cyanobacteria bacterium]|nr:site-specific integrase [Cyanobacteriota bacterium]